MLRNNGVALCLVLWACAGNGQRGNKKFTDSCQSDVECASGRCLEGPLEERFCSQACGQDIDCASRDTLYCCESLGEKAYCIKPATECRAPTLVDGCSGPGDPYCARGGMSCEQVGGRLACTIECINNDDCQAPELTLCQDVGARRLCVPIDPDTLPRKESNCLGDRDCTGANEVCQLDFDNRLDPRLLITICSAERPYGQQAAYTSCSANDGSQCDRFFCVDKYCPATCANDSHCAPGFECQPSPFTLSGGTTIFGLCTKRKGSGLPCDRQLAECTDAASCTAGQCPPGEACSYRQRYDGGYEVVCQTKPTHTSTNPPVSATYSRLDQACSPPIDTDGNGAPDSLRPVGSEIKLCDNDLCLSDGYCSAPCLEDADCPAAGNGTLTCTYSPFLPLCARTNTDGAANGTACGGANPDAVCASFFCNSGICGARKGAGEACQRDNECVSFECLDGKCGQLCRNDATCGGARVCAADPRLVDVFGTDSAIDDVIESPTFCADAPGFSGTACPAPSGCVAPQICRTFSGRGGALRGVCADKVSGGGALGAACTSDAGCASSFCLPLTSAGGICSELCLDDAACTNGTRCIPVTNVGTSIDTVCGKSDGSAADGAACVKNSDCASSLCVESTCRTLCPRGIPAGSGCPAGGVCAGVAVASDARYTEELFDDRYGTVLACVDGAAPFAGDPTSCAAPREFVFRNVAGVLVGSCLTPLADARADGAACRSATECKSGLCVDNLCTKPCTTTPSDSCASPRACDTQAPALLGEYATITGAVAACRKPCTQDSDCGTGTCSVGPPRFCR